MDNILGQIKDIIEPKDAILYYHTCKEVVKQMDNLKYHSVTWHVSFHTKILVSLWLAQPMLGGGVNRILHIDLEVQIKYMITINKLVHDKDAFDII